MKNQKLLEGLSKNLAPLVEAYVDNGGNETTGSETLRVLHWEATELAHNLARTDIWDAEARLCLTLLFALAEQMVTYKFVRMFSRNHEVEVLNFATEMDHPPNPVDLVRGITLFYLEDTRLADAPTAARPFYSAFSNLAWEYMDWSVPLRIQSGWVRAVARWHLRELLENLSKYPEQITTIMHSPVVCEIFEETNLADELFIAWAERNLATLLAPSGRSTSGPSERCVAFFNVRILSDLRNGKYHEMVMKLALMPEFSSSEHAVDMLLSHRPEIALKAVTAGIGHQTPRSCADAHRRLFTLGMEHLLGDGESLLRTILIHNEFQYSWAHEVIPMMLKDPRHPNAEVIRNIFLNHAAGLNGKKVADFWAVIATHDQGLFLPEWQNFSNGKSKPLREAAAGWLLAHRAEDALAKVDQLFASSVTLDRLAGISLLESIASEKDIERLSSMHASEPTKQVRVAIAALLSKHGVKVAPEPEKEVDRVEDIGFFESALCKRAKSIRLPKAPWLNIDALPSLKTTGGQELSVLATTFILQCQARGKAGVIVPEVEVLLPHLDRAKNGVFAHALLDQWFSSDMKAPTRWALDVAGITGDDSIIERLTLPIPDWCEANHGSRAEWAVHGIALLGSEKALGVLDSLIQRYRNHRRYVSAAASLAIFRTAEMMGIGADELAERIVPDFGFGPDGERVFPTRKGNLTAVLFNDFKIGWRDAATDQLVANPPGRLTEEAEEELKETRKFLRESITRQTSRLQDGMIAGRRWAVDVWLGRFGKHPVFRIFAMRLVWGVYGADGKLLRTFRLYPNGLAADAAGGLEEFSESEISIGLPHRMELDDKDAKAWVAHLKRFKVKPLFKQLDRPVYPLDPQQGNRREIRLTLNVKTTAGTLRKELLGRGWSLATAGDGGRLAGMWRRFPGCEIEAYLPADDLHAASTKDEEISLESAFFARGDSERTNYSAFPSESSAVSFGEVPAVLYSETISDLETLLKQS